MTLADGYAATDLNALPSNKASGVRRQIANSLGHIIRRPPAAHGHLAEIVILSRLRIVGVSFNRDPSGANNVDCNVVGRKFGGHGAGPSVLGTLGGHIRTELACPPLQDLASNIDDPAPSLSFHMREYGLTEEVWAP